LLIRTFVGYWRYAKDTRALEEAVKLADWNIAHSTSGDWPYGNLPYSTFQEKKPGGFRDKTGLMPDKAVIMALAYIDLYKATNKPRFLKAAEAIAQTLASRQRPNGTWPFRVDPKTEKVIEEYTSSVIYAVQLFESLDKINGNNKFRAKRDRTWKWLLNGAIKTREFRGFYEDIPASPKGRTNYDCLDTIRYLLANRTDNNGYLEMAEELNTWIEETFLDKIKGFEPAEGIRERFRTSAGDDYDVVIVAEAPYPWVNSWVCRRINPKRRNWKRRLWRSLANRAIVEAVNVWKRLVISRCRKAPLIAGW